MSETTYLSFTLAPEVVEDLSQRPSPFPNLLAELTYLDKYSRKIDGDDPFSPKERFWQTITRVTEGTYSILKDWCEARRIPWSEEKAQRSAAEFAQRAFDGKWSPPGRGYQMMGSRFVHERQNSAPLQNCAFSKTHDDDKGTDIYASMAFTMEGAMLGIGPGFDNSAAGEYYWATEDESADPTTFVIPDTREGWVEATDMLLRSLVKRPGAQPQRSIPIEFDYSEIRPAGTPIKTFGGEAAGPGPLIFLHDTLREIAADRDGLRLETEDVADIGNLVGKCVVSGNIRRTAEIFLGPFDEVKDLKDYRWDNDAQKYVGPKAHRGLWGHLSNNSAVVKVGNGTPYEEVVDYNFARSEPGLVFMDLIRDYGRLGDPADYKDQRAAGVNPCVTADTWVTTSSGARQVKDLLDGAVHSVVNGQSYHSSAFFSTGVKDVVRLDLADGRTLRLTADHRVMTTEGWVEAGDLDSGHDVVLHNHRDLAWEGLGSVSEGYLMGHLVGDGTFSGGRARVTVWEQDSDVQMRDTLRTSIEGLGVGPAYKGWSGPHGNGWSMLSTDGLTALADKFGIRQGDKHISPLVERASSAFTEGFLRGLFDADGSVQGSQNKGVSARLAQSDHADLQAAQRMLARLGVNSRIYLRREAGSRLLPDGAGGVAEYGVKTQWELVISNESLFTFRDRVGFSHSAKASALDAALDAYVRAPNRERFYSSVVSVTPDGTEEVYDVSVDEVHAFDANGMYVHNCGEQALESFECCTLVETYPTRCEDKADYLRTLKFAYLYAKAVTLMPTHWDETNAVMQRNRRIGTSMTGIAAFVESHGTPTLRKWQDEGFDTLSDWDRIYSEWLCVRESIKKTSVKPSGTVSKVWNVTPGVHWNVATHWVQRMRFPTDSPIAKMAEKSGYFLSESVTEVNTSILHIPMTSDAARAQHEVSVWEKMALAASTQRYWADNQVSCTLTFTEAEKKDLANVLRAYEGQYKAISMQPISADITVSTVKEEETAQEAYARLDQTEVGGYVQVPMHPIDERTYEFLSRDLNPVDLASIYDGEVATEEFEAEKYCNTDVCLIEQ